MSHTALQKYTMPALPIGSLDAYIAYTHSMPLLTLEEEQQLSIAWAESKDVTAARQLILPHLRFVVGVARKYLGYGLPLADLIQEGNVGLMKAVQRFEPSFGVRLVTFAIHWIKSEIHDFIISNWRIVKIATTKAQRKLFFNLRKGKKVGHTFSSEEAHELAETLSVSVKDVREMETRLQAYDQAFDVLPHAEDDHALPAPEEFLSDVETDPARLIENHNWEKASYSQLRNALVQLSERERMIIETRWLAEEEDKPTLQTLAEKLGISLERVRQIEKAALAKLKVLVNF